MARPSSSLKRANYFLRKHRKWPHSPFKAKWDLFSHQKQALKAFVQQASMPQQQNPLHTKPPLLSTLLNTFDLYNTPPIPQAYSFLFKTLFKTSQFHHIPTVLDHLQREVNFETPEYVFTEIIKLYGETDRTHEAIALFYRIPSFRCVPTVFSLNALLYVLCRNCRDYKFVPEVLLSCQSMNIRLEESSFRILFAALCRIRNVGSALDVLGCMVDNGFDVDSKLCSLLVKSECEEGSLCGGEVVGLFRELKELGFRPRLADYSNVIKVLVKKGMGLEALEVLDVMRLEGIKPDIVCYTMVLDGVIEAGDYEKADELFNKVCLLGLVPDVYTYSVYIRGLCKQGKSEAGSNMISRMEESGCKPNIITYNTMIDHFCEVGEFERARELLKEMESKGIVMNRRRYSMIVEGYAGNGQVVAACIFLEELLDKDLCTMNQTFDRIMCALCQRGFICEALQLLDKMVDKNLSPDAIVWEVLLHDSVIKLQFSERLFINLTGTKLTDMSICKNVSF